jgi:hypothetical protein
MANESVGQNFSESPDLQARPVSEDDITHPQEQLCPQPRAPLPDRFPHRLIE